MFLNYRMYKNVFGQDSYFSLLPQDCVLTLVKFRTTNNVLPVNKLRCTNVSRKVRLCSKCDLNEVGDEYHYLFAYPHFLAEYDFCLNSFMYNQMPTHIVYFCLQKKKNPLLLKLKHFVTIIETDLR